VFKFSELKQLHLEITNNCQASCPMCSRNHHGGQENPLIKLNSWTLEDFKTIVSLEVLAQIEAISFCGNFGDPLLNKDLLDMCKYVTDTTPHLQVRIHTNGSIRDTSWWTELASALPKNHTVIFGVDGLEDTNHIYRIGTSFKKIMENAQAFINAGGIADWTFIVFKHNEHQVSAAEEKAKELGFAGFTKKNSSRFLLGESFPVLDKLGNVSYELKPSTENKMVFIDRNTIKNYKQVVEYSSIECVALHTKEVYIDAFGRLFPCCWIASTPYNYWDPVSEISPVKQEMLNQFDNMINDFGGIDKLDTKIYSVQQIIDSNEYQTLWSKYWTNPKMITCAKACGKNTLSKTIDQFVDKTAL
jgi:MoaA/NifB/PqqE/SkfB family radical SAM enzyme